MNLGSDLLSKLTIEQAKILHQFLRLSNDGDRYREMSAKGHEGVSIEWVGWQDNEATHCRVIAGGYCASIVDAVITKKQVETLLEVLTSEISRAFDKPSQSIFRSVSQ